MKQTLLLLLLAPFMVLAQLNPQLIPDYQNPNDCNKPLDSAYVPGKMYRVDSYSLSDNQSNLELYSHYLIETDDNFMLKRESRYIDKITEYTNYTKYVSDYTYHNNKLVTITHSQQKINETILKHYATDSLFYKVELLSIKDRWNYNIDSGTVKNGTGAEYLYDSLNRFTQYKPYNFNISGNVIYTGFYTIDSFTFSSQPAKISSNSFPEDPVNNADRAYRTLLYDSAGRLFITDYYRKLAYLEHYFVSEGTVSFYTQNRPYPDSIIASSLTNPFQDLAYKKVFIYTPTGHIAEILTYSPQGSNIVLSAKEVYTPLLSSSVPENKALSIQFHVMPNPNQGSFRLLIPDSFSDCIVSITNILGAEVYKQQHTNSSEIALSLNLTPGIYSITLNSPSGVLSKKMVIY